MERTDDDRSVDEFVSIGEIIQKNTSKSLRELKQFIAGGNFITEKGNKKTNVICVNEKRTYDIPKIHQEEFFTRLEKCRRDNLMIHYAERQETESKTHTGMMIDFDHYQTSQDVAIQTKHFDALTRQISRLLGEVLDWHNHAVDDLLSFHLFYIRKPSIARVESNNGAPLFKDGFHILIPEIQITRGLKKYIVQQMMARNIVATVFKDIQHIGDANKMLDAMSASNPVHFFGNSKPDKPAYPLAHVYEVTLSVDGDVDRKQIPIADVLAKQDNGINLSYELSLAFYFERFNGKPTWLVKREYSCAAAIESSIQTLVERHEEIMLPATSLSPQAQYVHTITQKLDLSNATDYGKWFRIICAIAHTGQTDEYKYVAEEFSKRRPQKWNQDQFDAKWEEAIAGRMRDNPVTLQSIKYILRTESPEAYKAIEDAHYVDILKRAAFCNEGRIEHHTAALLCHALYSGRFVVDVDASTRTKQYKWYEFVVPNIDMRRGEIYKWREEVEPDTMHLLISNKLPEIYKEVRDEIKSRKDAAQTEEALRYWNDVSKTFKLCQSKLGNDVFQRGVINQAKFLFRTRGFLDELDSYEDVIGVGNGVLVLGTTPQLIKGYHNYRISKFTEVAYYPYDENNIYAKTLLSAYRDIFPEEDVFEYMMMLASTGLDLREAACILTLLVGGGQNGKTFFVKMMHNTLGHDYCAAGKPQLIVSPFERAGEANSAQMQQRGKRWFYIDEFNKSEVLNTARVKAMVTNSWQSGRDLHERQTNFKNTSNTLCLSNFDFTIETTEHGTWRRIYYYRNKVKFCDNPDPNNPFERKVDRRFMDLYTNDPLYLEANLSILAHYNARLRNEYGGDLNRVPVPTIKRETQEFRNRQDTINRFITTMLVRSNDCPVMRVSHLCDKYIEWYANNVKKNHSLTIIDVAAQFENSAITNEIKRDMIGDTLPGYRFRMHDEDAAPIMPMIQHHAAPERPIETQPLTVDAIGWEQKIEEQLENDPLDGVVPEPIDIDLDELFQ